MDDISSKRKGARANFAGEDLKEALDKKNIAFKALFSLIERLGTTLDLEKVVRLFLTTLMGQIGLRKVALYLPAPGERVMVPYHSIGLKKDTQLPPLEKYGKFMQWLQKSGTLVHIDNFFNSAGGLDEEYQELNLFVEGGFAYVLPLVEKEETIGVILLSNKVAGEGFSEFDVEMMLMISRVASITIRNAWLYQKTTRAKSELENFSKVKKQFINHTSHELRTPLTVINSTIWSIDVDEGDSILLNMARDAVTNLKNKVELLLSLNDIELNENALNPESCDVYSILEDCLREIIAEVEEKRVRVTLNNKAGSCQIKADPSKLKIVYKALIDNALNYVKSGGEINIDVELSEHPPGEEDGIELKGWNAGTFEDSLPRPEEPVDVLDSAVKQEGMLFQPSSQTSYLVARVSDDGIGIPQEEIVSLSEPFKRASNSPLADVRGLGIGLSISQRIVSGHGGRLFCKSEQNGGSEFSVWLPAGW